MRRTFSNFFHEFLQNFIFTFRLDVNTIVVFISDKTSHAEVLCDVAGESPEENTLHVTCHFYVDVFFQKEKRIFVNQISVISLFNDLFGEK